MAKILIKNGRIWDGTRFLRADVLTEGALIAAIGENLTASDALVYDAAGKTVSAGFVDVHTHMWGVSTDKFGIQAEISCLPFGVTVAADASGEQGDRALLDRFLLKTAVFVKSSIRGNRADFEKTQGRMTAFGSRVVGIKVYFDTTMTEASDATPLREICDFAHEKGLRVMVHCSHSPIPMAEILEVLGTGDILTHAFHGGENNAAEDGFESMRRAQRRGVVIDAGLAGHVHTDFSVLRRAVACGVLPDTVSTDITRYSAFQRGGRYGMTMCMSIARHLGMPEEALFAAVTKNAAKALGKENEWGMLRVGGHADIAVLSENGTGFDLTDKAGNRIASDAGYQCELTVLNGQVVYAH